MLPALAASTWLIEAAQHCECMHGQSVTFCLSLLHMVVHTITKLLLTCGRAVATACLSTHVLASALTVSAADLSVNLLLLPDNPLSNKAYHPTSSSLHLE